MQGAAWQRCQRHFTRNLLSLAPKGQKLDLHQELRAVFDAPDLSVASRFLAETVAKCERIRPEVAERLEQAQDDMLSAPISSQSHMRRVRTTNCLERLNQEIRCRTRVVRIFTDREAALRLITALCVEQWEEWETGRALPRYAPAGWRRRWKRGRNGLASPICRKACSTQSTRIRLEGARTGTPGGALSFIPRVAIP
ncbi:transposase [Candidatus Solincola tengchongensis]|uniref:transposase n=1 Tax=Candidatus Solincola tengchongensis TaxID=2900693 RepID=UPI0033130611